MRFNSIFLNKQRNKQTKRKQFSYYMLFLNFLKIILVTSHFLDLPNLVNYMDSMFPCYSLLNIKVICIDYPLLTSHYKFIF